MDTPGIGKAVKGDALHITLGVLHLAEEEVQGVTDTLRSSEFSEDLRNGISGSASRINLGCTAIRQMSLRPRKTGKVLPEPVLTLSMEEGNAAE